MLGYQLAPIAMVSLLLGLGGGALLTSAQATHRLVGGRGLVVSLWLGWKILAEMHVPALRRPLALLPGLAAVLLLARAVVAVNGS